MWICHHLLGFRVLCNGKCDGIGGRSGSGGGAAIFIVLVSVVVGVGFAAAAVLAGSRSSGWWSSM